MNEEDIIAVGRIVKDCRKALEPALKPLEGEIRGELGMGEMAKLSTMLLTYNLDKSLSTPDAARNYIAMQNIMLAAAQRAVKLPDMENVLPPEAKDPRVAPALQELGATALLSVLQKSAGGFTAPKPVSFDD
ncbi:MAG: hypothetical protein AB7G06_05350 [Bdellovibrionales bacterium]